MIHEQRLAPETVIAHSLGGNIALRCSGVYPENVRRLVAIEGLGSGPRAKVEERRKPIGEEAGLIYINAARGSARHKIRVPVPGLKEQTPC